MARQSTAVFFRDDDVGACSGALRSVVELLLAEGVPCNYQIVPALLEPQTAEYLRAQRARHPGLIELNQHGHRHRGVSGGQADWAEFGGGRSEDEQRREIRAGRETLQRLLAGDFGASIFTPPCHKFDAATLRALGSLGVAVLSAGVRTGALARIHYGVGRALGRAFLFGQKVSHHGGRIPGFELAELSVAIDVDEDLDRRGARLEKTAAQLASEFECARRLHPIVGVMLHHETYQSARKLDTLRQFIRNSKRDPSVGFRTLEALAAPLLASGLR